MQLIGMLDSPYVRRTAICLKLLGLQYEHRSLSVFRTFDEFSMINPVVKAPSLTQFRHAGNQPLGIAVLRIGEHLSGGPGLDDHPVFHDGNAIAEMRNERQVVAD